jgi:threonine/homoserine/homoserine lactone efflux protein
MVVVVTASGALAPGPLFFATIAHGAKSGAKSGLIFSLAHTIVEFSLVIALALGLLTIANEPTIKLMIGVVGGAALLVFGVLQIRDSLVSKSTR